MMCLQLLKRQVSSAKQSLKPYLSGIAGLLNAFAVIKASTRKIFIKWIKAYPLNRSA